MKDPRSIIHVDMDAFYASVEQLDQPKLAGRPVVVGGTGNRGVVAAASYEARRFGIHSAMPTLRARSLCPTAVFVKPRMARYREVSGQIFQVFESFTPLVEGLSLDEAFLDVTGSTRLYGDARRIGEKLKHDIRDGTGLSASVGIAQNKFLAKLASDADKPDGLVVVEPGHEQEFLDPMPVGRLWGIGRKTGPKLQRLGILTIGQLRKADREALRVVLGHRSEHFLGLAHGLDERQVEPGRDDKSMSQEVTFDRDLLDVSALRSELQRQSESVMRRVRTKGLAARTVQVKIRDHRFQGSTRSRTLRVPTASTSTAFRVADGLLAAWLQEHRNTPVRLLGMGVSGLETADFNTPGLDQALDRISDRYGDDSVTRGLALRPPHARQKGE